MNDTAIANAFRGRCVRLLLRLALWFGLALMPALLPAQAVNDPLSITLDFNGGGEENEPGIALQLVV